MKTLWAASLFEFQICLWAQFIFVYKTSDQAFKQKPSDQKITVNKHLIGCACAKYSVWIWSCAHQYCDRKCYLCRRWRQASRCYQSEILHLYCIWNDTVQRDRRGRADQALWRPLCPSGEGAGGASAPARWPLGTSRALCLTERQAFVNTAGDGLWFIHSFSRISLSSYVLLS